MTRPLLSVLVPAVPSRLHVLARGFGKAAFLLENLPVEMLVLADNKRRSVGMKRQALLDIANGEYVCYLDDDDSVAPEWPEVLMPHLEQGPDVVVFPTLCVIKSTDEKWSVSHDIANPNEDPSWWGFKRKPWMCHPIRADIAKSSRFTDKNYGEDADWLRGIWPQLKTQAVASTDPLYFYTHAETSEARP